MASKIGLGKRRDAARQSIEHSIKTLASKFGVEVPEVLLRRAPNAEHAHMMELERIAEQLFFVVDQIIDSQPVQESKPPSVSDTSSSSVPSSKSSGNRSRSK